MACPIYNPFVPLDATHGTDVSFVSSIQLKELQLSGWS